MNDQMDTILPVDTVAFLPLVRDPEDSQPFAFIDSSA